jgi:flagellar protein FlbD
MISVTRLDHTRILLNPDLIETIETTPDTVITLTTRQTLMVLETSDEIVTKIVAFRNLIGSAVRPARTPPQGETAFRFRSLGVSDNGRR